MNKFAFILHYIDLNLLYQDFFWLRKIPPRVLKRFIWHLSPYRYMQIGPINSISGASVIGIGIVCPLLPEHFVTVDANTVLTKIVKSVKIGEVFGARIVGLGGFNSIFGNEGEEVARQVNIAVTSGNTYTAGLAIQGILRAAQLMERDLNTCRLAIIGATGDIGSICTRMLSKQVGEIILVARRENRLADLAAEIQRSTSVLVKISQHVNEAVKGADLILNVASAITTIIEPRSLKPGAIICDVAYPAGIIRDIWKYRDDVLAFEGGMATWVRHSEIPLDKHKKRLERFNPPGTIHGCLAETILLALEGRYANYSIGRWKITEQRVQEMIQIAGKHGFTLAPFHCGSIRYSLDDIRRIRKQAVLTI